MVVKFKNGHQALSTDIDRLKDEVGVKLPKYFLDFISINDGAIPEANSFRINRVNDSGVNEFIPVGRILPERILIENLNPKTIPIAWAEGGNYVLLDCETGNIYFWDHEQPIPLIKLADNFKTFVDMLEPFDPKSITFKPNQVTSAWIDPDFLKSLDEKN